MRELSREAWEPHDCHQLGICHCPPGQPCASRAPTAARAAARAPLNIPLIPPPRPRWQTGLLAALRWGWHLFALLCVGIVLLGAWGSWQVRQGQRLPPAGLLAPAQMPVCREATP